MAEDVTQGTDRDFIEYIVKQIVESPDEVEVTRDVDEMGVLITLKVGKNDMGKVIGKSGQTAKSLRILLRVIGSKNNSRVNLKIVEPEGEEAGAQEIPVEETPAEEVAEEAAE
ncbi:MAG: KH domain-containing protein [Patescibacteria group bacterium]|nr:KH domain-containing protein [Patescibacteria group bacterium]